MKQRMDHETEFEEEEKASSDCTSGCQSGWTMYFEKSYESKAISMQYHQLQDEEEEEEEEDLSMVSDASSGPPHFRDDDDEHCCCCFPSSAAVPSNNGGKKRRIDTKQDPHSSPLDDTASSPLFSLSKTSCNAIINTNNKNKIFAEDVLELSCGFSATQFKGKSIKVAPLLSSHPFSRLLIDNILNSSDLQYHDRRIQLIYPVPPPIPSLFLVGQGPQMSNGLQSSEEELF